MPDELTFQVMVSTCDQTSGPAKIESGTMEIVADGVVYQEAAIGPGGLLEFRIPTSGPSSWILSVPGKEARHFRAEFVDDYLYVHNEDRDDEFVEYYDNGQWVYIFALEYWQDGIYICNQGDLFGPYVGRTYTGVYRPASGNAAANLARLPLSFVPNQGQTDSRVSFTARGRGYGLFLTQSEAVLSLGQGGERSVIRLGIKGSDSKARITGRERLKGKVNYFIGNDKSKWLTNLPTFAQVAYEGIYPGVDLVFYGREGELEYDFVVQPGADPGIIRLVMSGQEKLWLDAEGNLILQTKGGQVIHKKPLIFQEIDGRGRLVKGGYTLLANNEVGFEAAAYDPTRPLIIDPELVYSTYLGGSDSDWAYAIAVDSTGAAYVTGHTGSNDFPTQNALLDDQGREDAFVTKLAAGGSSLVYSTYLGGSHMDYGDGIAVDLAGAVYVTGPTHSTDFPTQNPIMGDQGRLDCFVTKLSADGASLVYSTYLGGGQDDYGRGIAVDSAGAAYVAGSTYSIDFPLVSEIASALGGTADAFVTKVAADGSAWVYSTYLGGSHYEHGEDVAVDSTGAAYVTGYTYSEDFPLVGAIDNTLEGTRDAFVTKVAADGSAWVFSTYLGGSGYDHGYGIAVDSTGAAYVTGDTYSSDFPTQNAIMGYQGGIDAFVTKVAADGSAWAFSTCLGGDGYDHGFAIAVDSTGAAYVAGTTYSSDFPLADEIDNTLSGGRDAFVTKVAADGSAWAFSTYLGGNSSDDGYGIAVDSNGAAYVTGSTYSSDFLLANEIDRTLGGTRDAFVTKLLPTPEAPEPPPCGPEDYWGGGGRLGNWWPPISEEVNQAIATGGALCLNRVWPFCLGTDPLSGEKILDPQNSHLPGLMFRWTYPDGSSEEWWLAIGFSGTLANGISWETQLGENAGVWNVLLHYCLPPQFLLGLASGTHQATYWLRDIDGNDSNKRWEMIEVE